MTQGFELRARDQGRRARGAGSLDAARPGAAAGRRRQRRRRRLRIGMPLAPDSRGPGRAHAAHADRVVRRRVPLDARLRPAGVAAGVARRDGRRQRRHRVEVRRAARDAALHPGELHAVHGVHRGLPRHGAARTARRTSTRSCGRRSRTTSSDGGERQKMLALVPEIDKRTRDDDARRRWRRAAARRCQEIIRAGHQRGERLLAEAKTQFFDVIDKVPMAYQKTNAIFATPEKKKPGGGGIFSIFVSDLCKGCAACVTACGEHDALRMVQETEEVNAEHETGTAFLDLLPDTPQKYLGLYNDTRPQDSKTATLRNMLMVRRNYDALVSGDGACAGCGEKSILRAIAAVTEAYMRPLYHAKADRLRAKADRARQGRRRRSSPRCKARSQEEYDLLPPGRRAHADGARRRGRQGHEGADGRARRRSPTATSSTPSPRSCGRRRSTTRTCSRSTAGSPTACR